MWACSTHGTDENAYIILFGKPEGKTLLGRPRCRWEDNIRMNLREIWWKDVECVHLAQERDQCRVVVNTLGSISAEFLD
jgi:hypothetical protein